MSPGNADAPGEETRGDDQTHIRADGSRTTITAGPDTAPSPQAVRS